MYSWHRLGRCDATAVGKLLAFMDASLRSLMISYSDILGPDLEWVQQ